MDIPGFGIGRVIDSKSERFTAGDCVTGVLCWATFTVKRESELFHIPIVSEIRLRKLTDLTDFYRY
jgi:NADPH-dependent curcumin reductase CurA